MTLIFFFIAVVIISQVDGVNGQLTLQLETTRLLLATGLGIHSASQPISIAPWQRPRAGGRAGGAGME